MTRAVKQVKRIVWAVDPFEKPGPVRVNAVRTLQCLVDQTGAEVLPVYVLSPAELSLTIEFTPPWVAQYRPAAEKALQELVAGLKIPGVLPPEVVIQNVASTRAAVATLSDFALKHKADVIVVSTHARSGVSRLLLGSFAETLILHSSVPVLATGPGKKMPRCFRNLLFPTDLSTSSRDGFRSALCLTRQLGAALTIFHALPNPVEPVFESGMFLLGGAWVPVHRYFAKDAERRKHQLESWRKIGEKTGVPIVTRYDDLEGNIANRIIEYSMKKRVDLLVMTAVSGPVSAALIGSITRQVVRHSPIPVWILRKP